MWAIRSTAHCTVLQCATAVRLVLSFTTHEQYYTVVHCTNTSCYGCALATPIVVSNHTSVHGVPECTQYMFRVKSTRWNTEICDNVFFDKKAQGRMRDSSGSKKLLSNSELYTGFR